MSYSSLGAISANPAVAVIAAVRANIARDRLAVADPEKANLNPWGKTQPQLDFKPGFPITLLVNWDAQGNTSPGVTEVRPGYAKFGKLMMPESDHGSTRPDPPPGDRNPFPTIDCFNYGERRIDFNTLYDGKYAELAGLSSLLIYKERRMRRLLDTLALPQFGFPTGLDALAYDASLHARYVVAPGFHEAVKAARKKFNDDFPDSRWQRGAKWSFVCNQNMIDAQWNDPRGSAIKTLALVAGGLVAGWLWYSNPAGLIFTIMTSKRRPTINPVGGKCPRGFVNQSDLNWIQKAQQFASGACVLAAENTLKFDTWVDPKNALATCVGKTVLGALCVQGPLGGHVSGVYGLHARRIPVWYAVQKVGRTIAPTPWFAGFLDCLLGGDSGSRLLRTVKK
jgi:hypothetical protein